MSQSSAQDKTEKATPQKIRKAREQGQIPRAKDFTAATIFIAVIVFFYFQMNVIWQALNGVFQLNMTISHDDLRSPWLAIEVLGTSLAIIIQLLLPLFALIFITAIASSLLLGGWLFYPAGVLPKLSKIDPIAGIKRMFSTRSLVELLKSTLKVFVIFLLLYLYLDANLSRLLGMQNLPLKQGVSLIMTILFHGILLMGIALLSLVSLIFPTKNGNTLKS